MWWEDLSKIFFVFSHKKEKHPGFCLETKLEFLLIISFFPFTKIRSDSRTRLECNSYNKEQEVKSWEVAACSRSSLGQVMDPVEGIQGSSSKL